MVTLIKIYGKLGGSPVVNPIKHFTLVNYDSRVVVWAIF